MTKKPFYDVFLNDIWSFSLYKLFPINQSKFDHLTSETPPPIRLFQNAAISPNTTIKVLNSFKMP